MNSALSPTPPFPQNTARLRLVSVLVPILGVAVALGSYAFVKGVSFLVGAVFFGDPLIKRGLDWLNRNIPDWPKYLELRRQVPTRRSRNIQSFLTIAQNVAQRRAHKRPADHHPPPDRRGKQSSSPTTTPQRTWSLLAATGAAWRRCAHGCLTRGSPRYDTPRP